MANRSRISSFQLQRPGAQQSQTESDYGPIESGIPGEKSHRSFDPAADPKWINISLVVRGDNQATSQRNVFGIAPMDSPHQAGNHYHDRTPSVQHQLWQRS